MSIADRIREKLCSVELDLLEKFKSICDKYGLSYSATSGTLLGAARHHGFIPWDDDIDVALPWEDYKRFLEVAPSECQYPYFFQSFLTEEDGEASASRLRRSDTTGFTMWEFENVGLNYNRGIFIDIFPLFNVPDSDIEKDIQRETILFFWKCIRGHDALAQMQRGQIPNKDYVPYIYYFKSVCSSMSIIDVKWAYLNACGMETNGTKEIGGTSSRVHLPSLMWNSEWYSSYIDLPFENTTIRCPVEYEKVLEKQYGDWRTPVKNGSRHEMIAIDPDMPWEEYDINKVIVSSI